MTLCSWQNDKIQELTKHCIQHSTLVLSRGHGVLCTVISNSENLTISLRHKAKFVLNCKHKIVTAWNSLKTSHFNIRYNSICRLSCSQMLLFEESHAWNKAKKLEVGVPCESVFVFKGKLVLWVCTMMHAFSFLIHPHMTHDLEWLAGCYDPNTNYFPSFIDCTHVFKALFCFRL